MRNECPRCEYRIQYNEYEKATWAEIQKNSPGPEADEDWPMSHLRYTMNVVVRAHMGRPKGYDRTWSVLTARLVDIYRDETGKMRAVDNWNLRKRREAQEKGRRPKPDEDDYDEE